MSALVKTKPKFCCLYIRLISKLDDSKIIAEHERVQKQGSLKAHKNLCLLIVAGNIFRGHLFT